jgi:predicted amidohydrolase YtcJ
MDKKSCTLFLLLIFSLLFVSCDGTPQPLSKNDIQSASQEVKIPSSLPPVETDEPVDPTTTADIIFHNGQILTMAMGLPIESAIAVKGEHILAVGGDDQILAMAGEETHMVDLGGKTLMPGFVDAHTHILNDAEHLLGLTLDEAQDLALENGITTLANMFVQEWFLQDLQNLERAGDLRVRTNVYLIGTDNCGAPQGDWYTAYPPTNEFGEMLRIGGIKLFTDGGSCGAAAVSEETFTGTGQGDLFMSNDELNKLVRMADDAGYQVAIHALGDRAIDQAIDALNAVIDSPGNPERHRIEHVSYLRDGQFNRFSEMGVNPVIFGNSPTCFIVEYENDLTEHFIRMFRRIRELVDANPGLIIAAKTDFPWRGRHASPLHELYSLTTSKEVSQDGSICEPAAWIADRALTIEEALPMVTTNAAYLLFREDEVGSLESGKLADLVILSANPLLVQPEDLKDIEIWMTMVGGETFYCTDGKEEYCPP